MDKHLFNACLSNRMCKQGKTLEIDAFWRERNKMRDYSVWNTILTGLKGIMAIIYNINGNAQFFCTLISR